jgi:hypothetical protein
MSLLLTLVALAVPMSQDDHKKVLCAPTLAPLSTYVRPTKCFKSEFHVYLRSCDRICRYSKFRKRVVRPYRAKLERMARCESTGRWYIATGNGFYGGLQFDLPTWHSVGGSGYPHQNSKLEQMFRAVKLIHRAGYGPWPVCGFV